MEERPHYTFKIMSSKTDQLGHGQKLIIPRSRNGICPYSAMDKYVQHSTCNHSSRPLFQFHSGQLLTRYSYLKHLRHLLQRIGYNPIKFNTHSFRIGASTSTAEAGIPPYLIKLMGRWHSKAYLVCTHVSTNKLSS